MSFNYYPTDSVQTFSCSLEKASAKLMTYLKTVSGVRQYLWENDLQMTINKNKVTVFYMPERSPDEVEIGEVKKQEATDSSDHSKVIIN